MMMLLAKYFVTFGRYHTKSPIIAEKNYAFKEKIASFEKN